MYQDINESDWYNKYFIGLNKISCIVDNQHATVVIHAYVSLCPIIIYPNLMKSFSSIFFVEYSPISTTKRKKYNKFELA